MTKVRFISGVLYELYIRTRLNDQFYRTMIRLAIAYRIECVPIKKQYMHGMSVVEMRMLN